MKFAKLYFLVLTLFIFCMGYKLLPGNSHKAGLFHTNKYLSQFESSASFEKSPCYFDFSIDLEEDESLDLIKKSSVYTVIFLFFSSFFMFSFYTKDSMVLIISISLLLYLEWFGWMRTSMFDRATALTLYLWHFSHSRHYFS